MADGIIARLAKRVAGAYDTWRWSRRFDRLRSRDWSDYCAFIGESGRAITVWLSPFTGDTIRLSEREGKVTTEWEQPPVIVPSMAYDRIVTALAASAAIAARQREDDGPAIDDADAALALRLARSIAGVEAACGRKIAPPWPTEPPVVTRRIEALFPDPLPDQVRRILARCHGQALSICGTRYHREVRMIATLAWMRGYGGGEVTQADLQRVLGPRPTSAYREKQAIERSKREYPPPPGMMHADDVREAIARDRRIARFRSER